MTYINFHSHIKYWLAAQKNSAVTIYGITLKHGPVGVVGNSEDVRGYLVTLLALVHVNHTFRVNRKSFVGVDDHTEQTRVRLNVRYFNSLC